MSTQSANPEMLKHMKIFQGLDSDDLVKIAKVMKFEKKASATQLIFEDQKASEVFFIVDGRVRIEMARVQGGNPEFLTTISAGDTVGELALARLGRRTASALTQMDTEVCSCDAKALNDLFDQHPTIGLKVFRNLTNIIADRLGDMNLMLRNASKA
jgi:CRP/FNR family cyclic AMP-dependent transcriptional regulator